MLWRAGPTVAAIAVVLLLAGAEQALAASDLFGNVAPESQVPGGGLLDRYPLSHYGLDQHFEAVDASLTGGVDVSGVPPLIAYFLANALWQLTAFIANALITLFTFAFSLDLVSGSEATGGAGALAPVSDAVRAIYSDVFGAPWLAVAIVLTGLWAMWRALIQRRYAETAGALGLSVVFVVIALAFVTQPERTIGQASGWSNDMSAAFLSLSRSGDVDSREEAKRAASDQLFELLVYEPWVVLNFGGVEHCVVPDTGSDDSDPESVAVRPLASDPGRDAELRRELRSGTEVEAEGKSCINNRNKYASHFLRFAPGSDDRKKEFEAINKGDAGELPDADPAKDSGDYAISVADKPAADAMEKDGQYQRLLMAIVIFAAELGAFLLLGSLSVAVILAQVLVLLLLAFAPVALVVGVFPGRGHDFFRGWLTRLAAFLLRKAIYSLILAVLLAVAAALQAASANLGWLLSFGLQALFFWSVFIYRKELAGELSAATAGPGADRAGAASRIASLYYARQLTRGPVRALRSRARGLRGGQSRPPTPAPAAGAAAIPGSGSRPSSSGGERAASPAENAGTGKEGRRESDGSRSTEASPEARGRRAEVPREGKPDASRAPAQAPPAKRPSQADGSQRRDERRPTSAAKSEADGGKRNDADRSRPTASTSSAPPAGSGNEAGQSPVLGELRRDQERIGEGRDRGRPGGQKAGREGKPQRAGSAGERSPSRARRQEAAAPPPPPKPPLH